MFDANRRRQVSARARRAWSSHMTMCASIGDGLLARLAGALRRARPAYRLLISLLAMLLVPSIATAETFSMKLEMEFAGNDLSQSGWQSPLVTYNGSLYFVWVDNKLRTMIAKKEPGGRITTSVIFENTVDDQYHNLPSVGIDADGYIHVVGNMHHSPYNFPIGRNPLYEYAWQYVVSDRPEDISSFTFVGSDPARTIPGTWITYPFFISDREGDLFVSFRHRVRVTSRWSTGTLAAGIARYDPDTKSWNMIGGTNYRYGNVVDEFKKTKSEPTTFFYTLTGNVRGTAYQPYRPRIFFDKNNRMHVTLVADNGGRGTGQHTHVIYAYSDDKGATFRRADGSLITSLPITLENADIVVGSTYTRDKKNYVRWQSDVGVTPAGQPVVSFSQTRPKGNYWSAWDGETWTAPQKQIGQRWFTTSDAGVMTTVKNGVLYTSDTVDGAWQAHDLGLDLGNWMVLDTRYLQDTNEFRVRVLSSRSRNPKEQVWTITLHGESPANLVR